MTPSPAEPTPYEVLGVGSGVSTDELRRAYRRALRQAHPDTGGTADAFAAVQRAWEILGDDDTRARYDRGSGASGPGRAPENDRYRPGGGARAETSRGASGVRARSYGHPGGLSRQLYLDRLREWVGLGDPIEDPYDPRLVHSAPPAVRRLLAEAIAEETTARTVSSLGLGYTIWNDVAAARGRHKIDHVVLGPSGLYALLSEDWGGSVKVSRGDVVGDTVGPDEAPLRELGRAAKELGRSVGAKFTASAIIVPDDALDEPISVVPRGRTAGSAVLRRSMLPLFLRDGIGVGTRVSIEDAFEVRTRLQDGIRFV